jgi:hypothetical protein
MPFPDCRFPILALPKHRGFKPPPLGGLFLGWGLNPQLKNFALICQLSTVNCQLLVLCQSKFVPELSALQTIQEASN